MFRSCRISAAWRLGKLAAFVAIFPLGCALGVWSSWMVDNAVLRRQALAITAGLTDDSARVRAVNDWVYHDEGFAKNHRFFVVPALGPTPRQVLETGGDCADKSRLVSALLRRLGIESGLLMISPCRDCPPVHTVVEARYQGGRMVVDPVWGVDYPGPGGRYLSALALAHSPLGREHIADLQRHSAPGAKIREMPATEATFDFVAAVNWHRGFATRAVAFVLDRLGINPERLMRPHFLEDPKLGLSMLLVGVAMALVVLAASAGFLFPGLSAKLELLRLPHLGQARRV